MFLVVGITVLVVAAIMGYIKKMLAEKTDKADYIMYGVYAVLIVLAWFLSRKAKGVFEGILVGVGATGVVGLVNDLISKFGKKEVSK